MFRVGEIVRRPLDPKLCSNWKLKPKAVDVFS